MCDVKESSVKSNSIQDKCTANFPKWKQSYMMKLQYFPSSDITLLYKHTKLHFLLISDIYWLSPVIHNNMEVLQLASVLDKYILSPCQNMHAVYAHTHSHTQWSCFLLCVPQHDTSSGSIITNEACILQEFRVHFSPAVELALFHRKSGKWWPPASKQVLYMLKIFLDTQQSFCLKILTDSLQFLQLRWISLNVLFS